MQLYKATGKVVAYFFSDAPPSSMQIDAEQFLKLELESNGLAEDAEIVEVKKGEKPAGMWDLSYLVYGSEDVTGDEPLTLQQAFKIVEFQNKKSKVG